MFSFCMLDFFASFAEVRQKFDLDLEAKILVRTTFGGDHLWLSK